MGCFLCGVGLNISEQKNLKSKSYKNKGGLYERQKFFVFLFLKFINFHSKNSINFTNPGYFGKISLCYKN